MKKNYNLVVVLLLTWSTVFSQDSVLNKYGLYIIDNATQFKKTLILNPSFEMVDLQKLIPHIIIDLKYCGNDNFMKTPLYEFTPTTYLRKPAAVALLQAQQMLEQKGIGLKIWDAYRPYSVTEKMWEQVQDERYAANPKFGSGHNRGIAVDLTLVNLVTGKELDMGTNFDNFSDTAHVTWKVLPTVVLENRALLQKTMEDAGFIVLTTEWWHYYLPEARKYPLLDLSFKQLKKITRSTTYN